MARTAIEDPIKVFRFRVEIAGFTGRYGFTEVTGCEAETESAEYREGGMNDTVQKSPGLTKYADVTLKRGQLVGPANPSYDALRLWYEDVVSATRNGGTADQFRREVIIRQYSSTNELAKEWTLKEAWPKKHKPFSDLNGTSSDNSIEEVVLCHEGFEMTFGA